MKQIFLLVALFLCSMTNFAQQDERTILRGKVLYRNSNVVNENVINSTSERATITNDNGEFAIRVKVDDELVFTSVNYQIEIIKITDEILERNRLVVEVNEKVTELDEVVISPENQQKFLELQNEDFKQFDYETDQSADVVNIADDPKLSSLQDGLNFVNIFKALFLTRQKEDPDNSPLKMSDLLRQVYEDEFFTTDLNIPADKIDDFLIYCDTQMPPKSLLQRANEFQLIDFLVDQSEIYLKQINAEE
ncbi:MAG: carboxypeptidase-like regulatory domain-containing protein [Flavobacteriaceae bacterium]